MLNQKWKGSVDGDVEGVAGGEPRHPDRFRDRDRDLLEVVVDGERGAARQPEVLDELPRLHRNPVRSRGRLHRDGEPILRAVPDLELVFGSILDAVPDDGPLELGFQPACRHGPERGSAPPGEPFTREVSYPCM